MLGKTGVAPLVELEMRPDDVPLAFVYRRAAGKKIGNRDISDIHREVGVAEYFIPIVLGNGCGNKHLLPIFYSCGSLLTFSPENESPKMLGSDTVGENVSPADSAPGRDFLGRPYDVFKV